MYPRNIITNIRTALADTPVVLINGARQTGKKTSCGTDVKFSAAKVCAYLCFGATQKNAFFTFHRAQKFAIIRDCSPMNKKLAPKLASIRTYPTGSIKKPCF
jgi:hypothetical protein